MADRSKSAGSASGSAPGKPQARSSGAKSSRFFTQHKGPDEAFRDLLARVTTSPGADAANLWWTSLSDRERELLHGTFENRAIAAGMDVVAPAAEAGGLKFPIASVRWDRMEYGEQLLLTTAIETAREIYERERDRGLSDIDAGVLAFRLLRRSSEQQQ